MSDEFYKLTQELKATQDMLRIMNDYVKALHANIGKVRVDLKQLTEYAEKLEKDYKVENPHPSIEIAKQSLERLEPFYYEF